MNAAGAGAVRGGARLAIAAWLAAFLVLLFAAAAWLAANPGRDDAPTLVRSGRQLMPNNSNARPSGDSIVVANRPDAPLTILAINQQPMRAIDYGRVVVDADPLPRGAELAVVWIRADQRGRPHDRRIALDRNGIPEPTLLDRDPAWTGDISFLALGVKGAMQTAWTVRSLRVEPISTAAVAGDIVRGWRAFEAWDGRSINVLFGGRDEQRLWLPALAFAAALCAALVVHGFARRAGRRAPTAALVAPFLLAWLVLDLRWQANLFEQARATAAQFGGRDWEQRHLAMEDGDLFRFVQTALAKMPQEPQRVFVGSDYEYFRRRAGYHLYPHNVLAYSWGEAFQLKPGEYLLLYQKADVKFDTNARELLWDNGRRLDAIPVIAQRGAGLFVVGPKGGR